MGKRFVQHVRKKVKYKERNPKSIAIRYDTIRTAILDVFPYMIHFDIDEENKKVIITAVLSTHQNPLRWEDR